jgi:hypothetical protein
MALRLRISRPIVAAQLARCARDEAGAVSVFYVLSFPLVIAGLAFATETGYWLSEQRRAQNVADAAAYSVGINAAQRGFDCFELRDDSDAWQALEATARRIATESGLEPDRTSVTVSCPQENQVGVEIDRSIRLYLLSALAFIDDDSSAGLSVRPRARAVVELAPAEDVDGVSNGDGGPELVCIHALNRQGRGLLVREETEIRVPGCRIQVDSGANNSIDLRDESVVEAACVTTRGRVRLGEEVDLDDLGPAGSECETIRERTEPEPLPPRLANLQTLEGLDDLPNDRLRGSEANGRNSFVSPTRQHAGSNLDVRRFQDLTLGERWDSWGQSWTFAPGLYVVEGNLRIEAGVRVTLEDGAAFVLLNGASIDIHQEARVDFGTGIGPDQCDPAPCPWEGLVLFSMGDGGNSGWQDFHADRLDGVVFLPDHSLRTARWDDGSLGEGCFAILADRFDLRQETEVEISCGEEERLRLCRQLGFETCGDSADDSDSGTRVVIVE